MRYVEPEIEQECTFEEELLAVARDAEAVREALRREAREQ
jgi:hypothetical protein